jgi:hypothetical protein
VGLKVLVLQFLLPITLLFKHNFYLWRRSGGGVAAAWAAMVSLGKQLYI